MDGRTDGRTDRRTDKRTKVPLCSKGLRPLWGRCPASFRLTSMQSRATAIADQVLPLGDLLQLLRSIFDLVLIRESEIDQKISINNYFLDENANFCYFGPFLACYWPVLALVSFSKVLKKYI